MKKTLAALAVLGAFAGTSLAADVTLYGVLDYGMRYTNSQTTETNQIKKKDNQLEMATGQHAGNRWGLKGTEDLGNGLKVGFNLESGFAADDGTLDNDDRLFGREAVLYVQGAFGEIGFGRTGGLDAGTGRYNLDGSKATPFGNGWGGDVTNDKKILLGKVGRMDNTITYKSPTFGGVTVYAQASLKQNNVDPEAPATALDVVSEDKEGSSDANRYYALGATLDAGALKAGLIASQVDYKRDWFNAPLGDTRNDDALAVEGYVNYDFGMVKPMLAVQYFDGGKAGGKEGVGVVAGATAPLFGGKAYAQVGYADYDKIKVDGTAEDQVKVYQVALGYDYALSKRTVVYAYTGYMQDKTDKALNAGEKKVKTTQFSVGITHNF